MRVVREGTRLALQRLSKNGVAQLVRQLSSAPVSEDAIAAVFRSTDGTPLYVDEAIRLLEHGGPEALQKLSTEVTAREVLKAHLSLLPEEAHAALNAAAVIGREFSLQLLSQILPHPEQALAAGEKARVIARSPSTGSGRTEYRFAHVLLQQALYDALETTERAHLHQQIARTLEGQPPLGIAAHRSLSGLPHADPIWAISLAERAAEDAQARLAYDAAADLYLRARTVAGSGAQRRYPVARSGGECLLGISERDEASRPGAG